MDKPYVLAMYDIRGKQEFIYRSVKLKEIVGGSAIIRDCFKEYLSPAAIEYRNRKDGEYDPSSEALFSYENKTDKVFSFAAFEERMASDQYIAEVVYCGGGNFLVLFENAEACKEVTYIFSKKVMEASSTLKVICTYVGNLDQDLYHSDDPDKPGDYERLYLKHRLTENQETAADPYATLPVVQADYLTSRPITKIVKVKGGELKLTSEQYAKYVKYEQEKRDHKDVLGEDQLDNMVADKGKDSLLAVIHIDGNSMGAMVQNCLSDKNYDSCVTALRKFSAEIQKDCIDDRLKEISAEKLRVVVYAGDDFTIICNAHDAFGIAVNYLKNLPDKYSSCAGIAIFHSHTPFADAYRIADQCCTYAKKKMKFPDSKGMEKAEAITDVCLLDFHYCKASIGNDIEEIRKFENHEKLSLPWLIADKKKDRVLDQFVTLDEVREVRRRLDLFGRSNTKGLLEPAQNSEAAFLMEIRRIISHMSSTKREQLQHNADPVDYDFYRRYRLLMRDLIVAYDLGFGKETDAA